MLVYKITVKAERERFMEPTLKDTSDHYVAAYSVEQAIHHVETMLKNSGWKISQIRATNVVLQDIRDSCDRITE